MQTGWPGSAALPLAHRVQLAAPPPEYLPASHISQPPSSVSFPSPVPCFPDGHAAQVWFEDAPTAPLYHPLRQLLQSALSCLASNAPYVPLGHSVEQRSKGSSEVVPGLHALHLVLPEELLANVPGSQATQSLSKLLAANLMPRLPRGHAKHCSGRVAPSTSLYFPFLHLIHDRSAVDRFKLIRFPY